MLSTIKHVGHRCCTPNAGAGLIVPEVTPRTRLESHEVTLMISSKNKTRSRCHNPSHSCRRISKFPLALARPNIDRAESAVALITINPDYSAE